jgi:hypothetical protein
MKIQMHLAHSLAAAAFLLVGPLALAQTSAQTKTASTASTQPRGNNTGTVPSGATHAAAAASARPKKHLAGVKYQDRTTNGTVGSNPLYKPTDSANLKSAGTTGSPHK